MKKTSYIIAQITAATIKATLTKKHGKRYSGESPKLIFEAVTPLII
jgi:hypothetical protein